MRGTFVFDRNKSAKDAYLPVRGTEEQHGNSKKHHLSEEQLADMEQVKDWVEMLEEQTKSAPFDTPKQKLDGLRKELNDYQTQLAVFQSADDGDEESILSMEQYRIVPPIFIPTTTTAKRTPFDSGKTPLQKHDGTKKMKTDVMNAETKMILKWTEELNNILVRALAPLMTVVGIVATRLTYDDVRKLLAWKENSSSVNDHLKIVQPANTVEEFIQINSETLGTKLLQVYIASYDPKTETEDDFTRSNAPIGHDCFNLDLDNNPNAFSEFILQRSNNAKEATQRALEYLTQSTTEVQFAPAWAFEVVSDSIFRAVLSGASFGAFVAAADQIRSVRNCRNFTIKELICSPQVRRQYAYIISSQYLLSGDAVSRSSRGKSRVSNYQNINAMRMQEGESLHNGLIWFESVYAAPNPILRRFEAEKQKKLEKLTKGSDDYNNAEARLNVFMNMLPQKELLYRG